MSHKFIAKIEHGTLVFPELQQELYCRYLADLEGKLVWIEIRKRGPSKTNQQLRAYFGLAVERIRQAMIDQGIGIFGIAPNKLMIHEILTRTCAGVGPLGEQVRVSDMTIDDQYHFFENVRDWAKTQLGITIPDPDPNYKDKI